MRWSKANQRRKQNPPSGLTEYARLFVNDCAKKRIMKWARIINAPHLLKLICQIERNDFPNQERIFCVTNCQAGSKDRRETNGWPGFFSKRITAASNRSRPALSVHN